MKRRKPCLTRHDAARLRDWLGIRGRHYAKDRGNVDALRRRLERAQLIDSRAAPPDLITMHSCVRFADPRDGRQSNCTLVFPEDGLAADERISVLAPLGAAILGCRAGDVIRFEVPGGRRTVRILEVLYQPEAAGDHHL